MAHTVTVRTATTADRDRILAISAQIWEGHDYVPIVLDNWLAEEEEEGEVVVAVLDGNVAAFAHRTWLFPGYAWFEGIRTDPAYRGRGAGRAITEYFITRVRTSGAKRIGLSTYIKNEASIHIIESYGFRRVAMFVYVEGSVKTLPEGNDAREEIHSVSFDEAIAFLRTSPYLRIARGYLPCDWKLYPFDVAVANASYRIGIRRGGRLCSLLCSSPVEKRDDPAFVSVLDGEQEEVVLLLARAHEDLQTPRFEAMIPKTCGEEARALSTLKTLGFEAWTGYDADILSYEIELDR